MGDARRNPLRDALAMAKPQLIPDFLTREQLAAKLGKKVKTLNNWAQRGKGPRSYRIEGGFPVYKVDDVAAWLKSQGVPV